ncbi:unnamed protein product [Cylicocyclus nassatus]|uniref:Mitochondrial import inner membrane translocase subunit TIM50 n=1 Tax=Cylicocyclus nassatus TaxID=53992 RepID=A0AA36GHR1_CYLNA|nr:unnamed protein product [Cylicocyclus nassatus]
MLVFFFHSRPSTAVVHIMALRLILDTLPKQVSRRWCNAAIIRTYSNEKPFKSLLADHRYFSVAQEDPSKGKEDALKKAKSESSPTSTSKSVEEVKPEPSKDQQEAERLSAIEELRLLKEALAEESKSGSGSEGPKGASDEHTFDEDAEKEKRRKRLERNTRIGGIILFGSSVAGLVAFCLYYGRSKRDQAGNVIPDEFTGSFFAPFYRIAHSFRLWRDFVVEPAREQLLPDPLPHPYIQPRYTLVIEMKNVLVHPDWTYKTGYRFAKRPALEYFLDVVGYPNFEVVIYTSEAMMTAHPVVDSFDPKQRIMYRLYRDCTKYMHGQHVKDLSKLNRDLSKVIFIEVDPKAAQLNPENVLLVPEWKGNMDDTSLVDLAELLKTIHLSDVEDVRPTLQYYSQFPDPAKEFRRRAIYLAEQEEQKKHQMEESSHSLLKKYSGRLFGYRRHAPTGNEGHRKLRACFAYFRYEFVQRHLRHGHSRHFREEKKSLHSAAVASGAFNLLPSVVTRIFVRRRMDYRL